MMSRWEKEDKSKNEMEIPELGTKISETKNLLMDLIANWRCQKKGWVKLKIDQKKWPNLKNREKKLTEVRLNMVSLACETILSGLFHVWLES